MNRLFLLSALCFGLILVALLAAQTPPPPSLEQTLRASRWRQRVLLLVAPTARQTDFQAQKALLAPSRTQLAARDFLVLDVLNDQLTATDQQFLAKKFGLNPQHFAALLLGKDGGVKQQSARPLTPATLFRTVDQMPMRRQELRRAAGPTAPPR